MHVCAFGFLYKNALPHKAGLTQAALAIASWSFKAIHFEFADEPSNHPTALSDQEAEKSTAQQCTHMPSMLSWTAKDTIPSKR
jgi:hypothetical protein